MPDRIMWNGIGIEVNFRHRFESAEGLQAGKGIRPTLARTSRSPSLAALRSCGSHFVAVILLERSLNNFSQES